MSVKLVKPVVSNKLLKHSVSNELNICETISSTQLNLLQSREQVLYHITVIINFGQDITDYYIQTIILRI